MHVPLTDHVVAYLDFLGFGDLVRTNDQGQLAGVLEVLTKLARKSQDFYLGSPNVQGANRVQENYGLYVSHIAEDQSFSNRLLRPAVAAFSDNLVVSLPVPHEPKFSDIIDADICLIIIQEIVAEMCEAALGLGLLVRGGVAVGSLYHNGGVVFGRALVEAYELESRDAIYPRVVVAPTVLKRCTTPDSMLRHILVQEPDGMLCLNYLAKMLHNRDEATRTAWIAMANDTVANKLDALEKEGRLRERAKWAWFASYLARSAAAHGSESRKVKETPMI
jgi:hypothetical protein